MGSEAPVGFSLPEKHRGGATHSSSSARAVMTRKAGRAEEVAMVAADALERDERALATAREG